MNAFELGRDLSQRNAFLPQVIAVLMLKVAAIELLVILCDVSNSLIFSICSFQYGIDAVITNLKIASLHQTSGPYRR